MNIQETIIVEGRDDLINLRRCVQADILITSGFGLNQRIFQKIEQAYKRQGIIIFTDPDVVGERIRKRLMERFPKAKHAFIAREDALKGTNVGVENATCQAIVAALEKVRTLALVQGDFVSGDLILYGLSGSAGALSRRDRVGAILGIGYGNSKQFLFRLNHFGVKREELEQALEKLDEI